MYCILVIGMTGQGKTTGFVKPYINGKNCFVFDVQNEYTDLQTNSLAPRSRWLNIKDKIGFFNMTEKKQYTICVFEEATIFLKGQVGEQIRLAVVSKRHTHNTYVFCFHSISAVPPELLRITNFTVLFKTGDEREDVAEKSKRLLPYFDKVSSLKQYDFITIQMIEQ